MNAVRSIFGEDILAIGNRDIAFGMTVIEEETNEYETVAKGPYEDILHETLSADYRPNNYAAGPQLYQPREPGVSFMSDGFSKVDFILVVNPNDEEQEKRDVYERELINTGLRLEYEVSSDLRGGLTFIKISAPWEVLSTYAEVMHFKMPVKESCLRKQEWQAILDGTLKKETHEDQALLAENELTEGQLSASRFSLHPRPSDKMRHKQFAVTFSRAKEYLFDIPEIRENFFTSAQRSQIVHYILQRKTFTKDRTHESFDFGINRLLADGAYLAAYPLHEGSSRVDDGSLRYRLLDQWASMFTIFKNQPLDDIRRYFGVKVGLYFAWLGFYTYMLIPASIVGLCCFLYGIFTKDSNAPSLDICIYNKDVVMCPPCDNGCEYWKLGENCDHSKLTYLCDNAATVLFSVFMAIWSATFLELWKRYCSNITYQWDLTGVDSLEENSRPEYVAEMSLLRQKKVEEGTYNERERLPFWKRRLPYSIFSITVIFLAVLLCLSAAVGVVLYRMTLRAALAVRGTTDDMYAPVIVSSTAAFLNLVCILFLNWLYERLAVKLTDREMPRTQTEYDDSLTLKLYLLQFVNCYSSIFYIALFKGKFVGRPGKYNYILGSYQQEVCGTGGCFQELSIQLAVIMIGKQAFAAITEFVWPAIMKHLQTRGIRNKSLVINRRFTEGETQERMAEDGANEDDKKPWERDYCLPELGDTGLFFEYLEMILQYGFVTLFVAAFPLAPFCALVNNILEIRFDAKKLLRHYRRPIGKRVKNIGVWYRIMDVLGKLAVLSNAVIIAFTSELIPRLYYTLKYNPEGNLVGYVNFTLSHFDTNHYTPNVIHRNKELLGNSSYCRYSDYRTPPWGDQLQYKRTKIFWEIFVWRLLFVILFENLIVLITTIIRWAIPDIPRKIREKIREDNILTNELIILQELKRRKLERDVARPQSR